MDRSISVVLLIILFISIFTTNITYAISSESEKKIEEANKYIREILQLGDNNEYFKK